MTLPKIIQLLPAESWNAQFQKPGDPHPYSQPLTFWALCEAGAGRQEIHGVVPLPEGEFCLAREQPGFQKYFRNSKS